jgi:hypothetical protein
MTRTNVCVRCGQDRGVVGDALLSNSKKTYEICFPCMKAWIKWRDQQTYEFMAASPDLDKSE